MALHTWLIFVTAVLGLALTPGPNGLLALSHGALYGHRKTLFTVSGGVLGFTLLIGLSMLGIGTLLQASAHALSILKWLGGAYLIWLGIQLWRAPPLHLSMAEHAVARSGFTLFRQGLLSALSNPKVILFFGAFLPQFLDPHAGAQERPVQQQPPTQAGGPGKQLFQWIAHGALSVSPDPATDAAPAAPTARKQNAAR